MGCIFYQGDRQSGDGKFGVFAASLFSPKSASIGWESSDLAVPFRVRRADVYFSHLSDNVKITHEHEIKQYATYISYLSVREPL